LFARDRRFDARVDNAAVGDPGELAGGIVAGNDRPRSCQLLEHDPEKWVPVFRKVHAQTKG
jgi:hypothetical protein